MVFGPHTRRDHRIVADGVLLNFHVAHLVQKVQGHVPLTPQGACVDSTAVAFAEH